ncbi:MAG TPA: M23 family metallopeptidase [Steroidobacteraceae bacterium]
MNVIVLSRRQGRARQFDLAHPLTIAALAALSIGILGTAFALGITLGQSSTDNLAPRASARATSILGDQQKQIAELRQHLQDGIDALALRMGQVNARVIRLDALGRRLTEMANIDSREFNFDATPPQGGPESEGVGAQIPDLTAMIDGLEQRVEMRGAQLATLENVILTRKLSEEIRPEGRPVRDGFISSYFGERQDPFTGHQAVHKGVDFAGVSGSNVMAVATGIVTWAGERSGYGNLVEVNHGNGLVTRYAHNQRSLVAVGDTVTRGEPVALMGSTGHSTGPHVHFEVLKNGRQIDPASFIGH